MDKLVALELFDLGPGDRTQRLQFYGFFPIRARNSGLSIQQAGTRRTLHLSYEPLLFNLASDDTGMASPWNSISSRNQPSRSPP